MKTPVAFLVFNRPDETRKVFEAIRKARPEHLLIVADGPRPAKGQAEAALCAEVKKIAESVDWPCTVLKNYADKNMGCKMRIYTGLDWVFGQVERAIILEDDCVPDPTFFPFCEELLEKYADDERVMHISGTSFHKDNPHLKREYSYYSSIYQNQIGWATWRRAWRLYDVNIRSWPILKKSRALLPVFKDDAAYERFALVWDKYYRQEINSWDSQWTFACLSHGGLALTPTRNLITNIGATSGIHFDPKKIYHLCDLPLEPMGFPLSHPPTLDVDREADRYFVDIDLNPDRKAYKNIARYFRLRWTGLYSVLKRVVSRQR
jgi:hypothetical protein